MMISETGYSNVLLCHMIIVACVQHTICLLLKFKRKYKYKCLIKIPLINSKFCALPVSNIYQLTHHPQSGVLNTGAMNHLLCQLVSGFSSSFSQSTKIPQQIPKTPKQSKPA